MDGQDTKADSQIRKDPSIPWQVYTAIIPLVLTWVTVTGKRVRLRNFED